MVRRNAECPCSASLHARLLHGEREVYQMIMKNNFKRLERIEPGVGRGYAGRVHTERSAFLRIIRVIRVFL
jgi:hypothetical protein